MFYIDDRERSVFCQLVESKSKRMNIHTEKKRLEVGDYVIADTCFEAKSVKDFMTSLISKRLWTQLDNMDRCFTNNFVVIYGSIEDACDVGNHIAAFKKMPIGSRKALLENKFRGAIGRILLDTDAQVIWTRNEDEAAQQVVTLAKMAPVERSIVKPTIHKRIATDDVRVDMLSCLKGISPNKANLLLETFGSIMELGECRANEICALDGIGETVAKRLIQVLNEERRITQ
mgnify:CR=1 FL=1